MKKILLVLSLIFIIFSCSDDDNEEPNLYTSLIDIIIEPSGDNCINGGYKIISGIDLNENQILDQDEVDSTEYLCNPSMDNEIRFSFGFEHWTTQNTEWELAPEFTYLKNFDIRNFSNISSAIFMATVQVQSGDVNNISHARLFNVTNNEVILGSEIESAERTLVWELSDNIIDNIPEHMIDIGIQIKSSNGTGWIGVSTAYLILYRN